MATYAIIETGGKQYRVAEGQRLVIEKLAGDVGSSLTFERVLLVNRDGAVAVGAPVVKGASVLATVASQGRGKKIAVVKYHPKVRYRKKTGHRQAQTTVTVTSIKS